MSQLIHKAENILKLWKHRQLSLMGKILLINTLVGSLFVYVMQVSEEPDTEFFVKFDRIITEFIWEGKRAKVPIELLQAPKRWGGLNLINLRRKCKALKIGWLFREEELVRAQLSTITPNELGDFFWKCNLNKVDCDRYITGLRNDVNPFWKEVIRDWFALLWETNTQEKRLVVDGDTVLWYNSEIRIQNQVVFLCKSGGERDIKN